VISIDGEKIAYTRVYRECDLELIIFDLIQEEIIASYHHSGPQLFDAEGNRTCASTIMPGRFNENATQYAFGERFYGDESNILILDLESGEIVATLIDSGATLPVELAEQSADPIIQVFSENRIAFTAAFGFSTRPTFASYIWNLRSPSLTQTTAFSATTLDIFESTGESVMALADDRFQNVGENTRNALHIYDPITRSRFPFFADGVNSFENPRFVQNGDYVVVKAMRPDEDSQWLLIQRDGAVLRPLRDIDRRDIHGTEDGFVYMLQHDSVSELVHFETETPFSDHAVWVADGDWRILWIENDAQTFGPYLNWAQLGEPIYDDPLPEITIAPTPLPLPEPILQAGMTAVVQTVGGEVLYLRDEPATGEIIKHLYDGNRVQLLEGPREINGYVWWHIRTSDDTEGWAAQAVDDVTTLLPFHDATEIVDQS
jgi:hypothetical protein